MADLVMEGRVLAQKYELVKLLGQGGMGAVYEARNHLGKRFAVKLLLKPEFAQDQGLATRFFREAKASAAIESQHIVQVYDTGVDQETGFPFIIMELLKGEDLEHTIARVGALNVVGAARVIAQAAMGLGKAHESGIVHRDIKPANIFMTETESGDRIVKILDFGIAKQQMEQLSSADGAGLTKTGSMLGTPLYMSPEQAQGLKTIDHRTDIWSLGMCLYEALSGRTPWGDVDTLGGLILSICSRDIAPLQDIAPWVPPELALIVHTTLNRDVALRTPSAQALVEALRPFMGGASQITPEILLGVEDAARATTARRADISQTQSTGALTSSQGGQARNQGQKKSLGPLLAGVAALAIVGIGGGVFVLTRGPDKKLDDKSEKPSTVEATKADPVKTVTAPTTPSAPVIEEDKHGTLTVKAPPGATVKVNNKEMTPDAAGKLELTGPFEKMFFVTITKGTDTLIVQKVYMGDGFVTPDVVDTSKPAVKVTAPVKAGGPSGPTGASAGSPGTTVAAPLAPIAGGGTTAPATAATIKGKPKVEEKFE